MLQAHATKRVESGFDKLPQDKRDAAYRGKAAGLVRDSRRGRERIWELETQRLELARQSLERISTQRDAAIGRLRSLVEEGE